ncbi:MAG: hypothetical protein IPJ81_10650 [Chitinophagaceae bacterium]|nr:hypothetical protein [Chitinophagaceae bacterium]
MKKLLAALAIGAMFTTSCKKDNGIIPGTKENAGLSAGKVIPIPVVAPAAFFVEKIGANSFNLYRIDNLNNPVPIVTKKSVSY